MTLEVVIAAKNNIIAISFFGKTRTVTRSDTGRGTGLGNSNSTFSHTTLFTSPLILTGTPHSAADTLASFKSQKQCHPSQTHENPTHSST
jgi:hypothetical protein